MSYCVKHRGIMIITVVCDVLGEENNGTTIAAMNLIRFLKTQGHTVRVLCGDENRKNEEDFFVVPNYNFGKLINSYVKKVGVALAKPDKEIIEKALDKADIVHIMVPLSLGVATAKIAKERGIAITAGFHMQAENLTSYFKVNKINIINHAVYQYIYKKLYKNVDAIHYPTQFIRDVFESHIKLKTNGYVISNGVNSYVQKRDISKSAEFKDKIIVLMIGRYAREKSQDILLKAIKYSKYKDKIQLILAGQGAKEKYYKRLAKKLPIPPIFKFYDRKEIIDVINYCDIYAHTAEVELEGIACLEAICCGKITLVSDSKLSATRNFAVDKKCIFKNRNPKDLARVIDYFIDNPEDKKIIEEKYLNSAICYSQEECMKRMEQMIIDTFNKKQLETEVEE